MDSMMICVKHGDNGMHAMDSRLSERAEADDRDGADACTAALRPCVPGPWHALDPTQDVP